ncbi:hypothetical protein KAR91_42395 [Candidatus Pacearchaeota archaeon]|nr:hypothetical protein [Candidatus Pacearchaeota archaeon]
MWYLFEYPLFARCKEGKMGVPVPGESTMPDEQDLHKRCETKAFEIEVGGHTSFIHVRAHSMSHALREASKILMFDEEIVTVRLEK